MFIVNGRTVHSRMVVRFVYAALLVLQLASATKSSLDERNNGSTTAPPSHSTGNSSSSAQSKTTTVVTSSTPASTSTHNKSTTASPVKKGCSANKNCEECADNYKCYWCGPSKSCEKWPTNKIKPGSCSGNKWYWKQCTVPGYVLIIVVPILGVLILLTFGCCIYCKCCRVKSKNREEQRIERRREEMKARHDERKKERQSRSDMIRQKYGLLKSDDEEPLL